MNTWHIHLNGQVQGVGFRPYVFILQPQKKTGLSGYVNNASDGVHVYLMVLKILHRSFILR